jgi:hypothetical protein
MRNEKAKGLKADFHKASLKPYWKSQPQALHFEVEFVSLIN